MKTIEFILIVCSINVLPILLIIGGILLMTKFWKVRV
jgi:hypothetical protein